MQIILIAALDEEADAFMPGVGEVEAGDWPSVRKITTDRHIIHIATTQIGKVNAAAAAAWLHARYDADMFLTIGTAGKLRPLPGDCFWLARAIQHDYGARKPNSFAHYPAGAWPMGPAHVEPYIAMEDIGTDLPHACIASGDAFIEDAAYGSHLVAALNADLVDMETAAVAQYATQAGIAWGGIKSTTDEANHDSAGDFHANLRAAARRAALAMEAFISRL
jgi:nucleoside phosphorylase